MRGVTRIEKRIEERWREIEKGGKEERQEKAWEKRAREEMSVRIEKWSEEEERRQNQRKEEEGEVIMYTDGSIVAGRVRVGVCRMGEGGMRRWGAGYAMGSRIEIMDAEMVGKKRTIERGIEECRRERRRKLTIRVDSQEAMRRCTKREHTGGEMMASKIW